MLIVLSVRKKGDIVVIPETELDHCPHCGYPFEIVAVRLSFFRQAEMLFVCPACGLAQVETHHESGTRIRDWIAAFDRKRVDR
jgi:predicted RNA-binding Zn-ribbon protein involved in translation (DUF1610 family)